MSFFSCIKDNQTNLLDKQVLTNACHPFICWKIPRKIYSWLRESQKLPKSIYESISVVLARLNCQIHVPWTPWEVMLYFPNLKKAILNPMLRGTFVLSCELEHFGAYLPSSPDVYRAMLPRSGNQKHRAEEHEFLGKENHHDSELMKSWRMCGFGLGGYSIVQNTQRIQGSELTKIEPIIRYGSWIDSIQ
jgi:hypothetical protein